MLVCFTWGTSAFPSLRTVWLAKHSFNRLALSVSSEAVESLKWITGSEDTYSGFIKVLRFLHQYFGEWSDNFNFPARFSCYCFLLLRIKWVTWLQSFLNLFRYKSVLCDLAFWHALFLIRMLSLIADVSYERSYGHTRTHLFGIICSTICCFFRYILTKYIYIAILVFSVAFSISSS